MRPGIEGALGGLGGKQQEGAWEALPAPGLGGGEGLGRERGRSGGSSLSAVVDLHQVLALV